MKLRFSVNTSEHCFHYKLYAKSLSVLFPSNTNFDKCLRMLPLLNKPLVMRKLAKFEVSIFDFFQVTIHGQLMIASRLSIPLNVRVFYSTSQSETNQSTVMLHQTEAAPSHILEPEHIKCIKVRAHRGPVDDYDWSSEVYVSAEKLMDNSTIQVTRGRFYLIRSCSPGNVTIV